MNDSSIANVTTCIDIGLYYRQVRYDVTTATSLCRIVVSRYVSLLCIITD